MRTRNRNGQFCKNSDEGLEVSSKTYEAEGEVFDSFRILLRALSKLWKFLPYFIVFYLIWRYFKILKFVQELLVELSCGEGCKCICPSDMDISKVKINMTIQSNVGENKGGL